MKVWTFCMSIIFDKYFLSLITVLVKTKKEGKNTFWPSLIKDKA